MQFTTINDYIDYLVDVDRNTKLRDFAMDLHKKFYPSTDISFMDDFLDMASQEKECQFVIPHQKLIDYGIAAENSRSNDIKKRLIALELKEGNDYLIRDISQWVESGTKHKKVYMLTSESFLLALMRAKRDPKQSVDPTIYAKYFQFLQKVVKYYDKYQIKKQDKLMSFKDDKIDKLISEVHELKEDSKEQIDHMKTLIAFGEKASEDNDSLTKEISQIKDTVTHTKEKMHVVYNHLVNKSITSTKNPVDKKDHHHAMVMMKVINGIHEFKLISGQNKYITGRKRELLGCGYTPVIDKFYQANGIDYRCNVRVELNAFIDNTIDELIEDGNPKAKENVNAAIKVSKLYITWKPNSYIDLNHIIAIMQRVNIETQTPPIEIE